MKLKLDENMPADLAALLEEAGHDVEDVVGEGLGGKVDEVIIEAATEEERILLTFDLDFADVRRFPPGTHHGIVVFRLQDQRWKTLERPVRRLLKEQHLEDLRLGLAIVDETRIRFRRSRK